MHVIFSLVSLGVVLKEWMKQKWRTPLWPAANSECSRAPLLATSLMKKIKLMKLIFCSFAWCSAYTCKAPFFLLSVAAVSSVLPDRVFSILLRYFVWVKHKATSKLHHKPELWLKKYRYHLTFFREVYITKTLTTKPHIANNLSVKKGYKGCAYIESILIIQWPTKNKKVKFDWTIIGRTVKFGRENHPPGNVHT